MERPEHQQMLLLAAAIGSPAGRERLRDVTNIMLGHVGGTPGSPDDFQDAETAEQEELGDCAELNAHEATLWVLLRANQCLVGTCKKGGKRNGCGAKRKHFATAEKTAAQVAATERDSFSTTKVRKAQVQTMLEERLGPAFKRNSLAKYIDDLLERFLFFSLASRRACPIARSSSGRDLCRCNGLLCMKYSLKKL